MVNMSAEDLQTKYDGHLNSEMVGPLHNLIAKVRILVTAGALWMPHGLYLSTSVWKN